jgi:hypothetical protein
MKKLTLFLLLLPLMAVQCKKDKDKNSCPDGDRACELVKLPSLTYEGKGTFGCLVNGKAWLPQSCCGGIMAPELPKLTSIYNDEEENYFLGAMYNNSDSPSILISFPITTFKLQSEQYELNVYKRDTMSEGVYSYCWNNRGCNSLDYHTNENQTGFFNVQYVDSARQIISGTFNFNAEATNGETVSVTEGRFDMWFEVQ